MASNIRFKRSSVTGKSPSAVQLPIGEIAMNTKDGVLWMQEEGARILNIRAGSALTAGRFIYVSPHGDDTNNDGSDRLKAKKTVSGAVAISTAGDTIEVASGTYVEANPIVVPPGVALQGEDLRSTVLVPQTQNKDFFHVNNGVHFTNFSFVGSASTGAVISFDPNRVGVVTQSPYIRNCTNFIPNSIGLRIDGNLRSGNNGVNGSMVVDSFTQYNLNGIGVSITNKAYAQLVSIFTINSGTSIFCESGGQCDITNSNSSFGEYGLVADNVSLLQYTGITSTASGIASDRLQIQFPVKNVQITNFEYDNVTGYSTVTTEEDHNLKVGYGASLQGIGFTCAAGYGQTHAVSGFIYNEATGISTITTATNHGVIGGDHVKLSGIAFTCTGYAGVSTHIFPDGRNGYQFKVDSILSNTQFTVNVGTSTIAHTYLENGIVRTGITTDIYPNPIGEPGKSGNVYDVIDIPGGNYTHKFVSAAAGAVTIKSGAAAGAAVTVTNATYIPATGVLTLDFVAAHGMSTNDQITISEESLSFTCAKDNYKHPQAYPRPGYAHTFVSGVTNAITKSIGGTITAEAGTVYDGAAGIMTVTSASHGLSNGNTVTLANDAVKFTCSKDLHATEHDYPRNGIDPIAGVATVVSNSQTNTFEIFVGKSGIADPICGIGTTVNVTSTTQLTVNCGATLLDARKFNIYSGISTVPHTFVQAGIRTVSGFVHDHLTGLTTITTSQPHHLAAKNYVRLAGIALTCTAGIKTYPDGNSRFGSVFEVTGITTNTFTVDVGVSTLAHTYVSGGTVRRAAASKLYANRPYDGQVVYLDTLYKQLDKIDVTSPGSGYASQPTVTISAPEGDNGTTATAEAVLENGAIKEINVTNNGSQYVNNPSVTLTGGSPSVSAGTTTGMRPLYYTVQEATQPDKYTGISTVVFDQVLNNAIGIGSTAFFYQTSLILASSHSFEWIGSGGDMAGSRPRLGGVGIQSAEIVNRDGGIVVYTSTDQSGNFRIGNDVAINQVTGTISGRAFNQSLLNTVTPLIIALED